MRRLLGRAAILLSLTSFVLAVTLAAPHQVAHHDGAPNECALCVVASERSTPTAPALALDAPVLVAREHATPLALPVRAGVRARVTGRGPPAPAFVLA